MEERNRAEERHATEDALTVASRATSHGDAVDAPQPMTATVGRYVVFEELGRGGMGRVVRAYDPKLRREVALKQIAGHSLAPNAEARLVREAQAMAQLSHPHVVAIYDVHADEAGITLVMEYVAGATLRAWLRAAPRSWREILDVFVAAGAGLAAAHEAGLVHRDFKPSNVLVTEDGRVKVTDFGLARPSNHVSPSSSDAAAARSGAGYESLEIDDALLTRDDVVLGTPPYMAPEQHEGRTPDARADQYGFCVALWSALNDELPFPAHPRELLAAKRRGPPSWPRPSKVPRRIVEAIERGLAPDPEQRWPSMNALLAALERDPSARRRRAMLVGGATVGVVGGAAAIWIGRGPSPCGGAEEHLKGVWDEVRRATVRDSLISSELSYAGAASEAVVHRLDDYAEQWALQHTDACEATTMRGEHSGALMDLRMACLHRARGALSATVDVLAHADDDVVEQAVDLVSDLPSLAHCGDIAALQSDLPPPADPVVAVRVDALQQELAQSSALLTAGKVAEGLEQATGVATAADELGYDPLRIDAKHVLGEALRDSGKYEEGRHVLEEAMQLALSLGSPRAAEIAVSLANLTSDRLGRADEARAWAQVAVGMARRIDPGGRTEALALGALGVALGESGHPGQEIDHLRAEIEILERIEGNALSVAAALVNLTSAFKASGRHEEAAEAGRRAVEVLEGARGPDHPSVASALNNLAGVLVSQGEVDEGEAMLRRAITIRKAALGERHPLVAASLDNLAGIQASRADWAEAEATAREAHAIALASLGPVHPEMALFHTNLGTILGKAGNAKEAERQLRRALEIQEATHGLDHPMVVFPMMHLIDVVDRGGRSEEALALAERAWSVVQEHEVAPAERARVAVQLAELLWRTPSSRTRAREVVHEARRSALVAPQGSGRPAAEQLAAWLDAHR